MLIADYEFGRSPQDIKWLEKMSNVAAAAHAPFIAAASPQMFDMDSFDELGNPRDLAKIFESTFDWKSRYAFGVISNPLRASPSIPCSRASSRM